jgi:Protein of unknown function (DUF3500)
MHSLSLLRPLRPCLWIFLAVALSRSVVAATPAEEMADAAARWLQALTPEQKAKATFGFGDDERLNWHFIPRPRKGLPLKEMSPAQRHLAGGLLATALSQRGYLKATTIMSLEDILAEIEQGRGPVRDSELYFVSVFGQPKTGKAAWGWRWEGHHLALNFTVADGQHVSVAPTFFGSNPGEVRQGPRSGLRTLDAEEDLGRALARSLDEAQRQVAVYTNVAPADILTAANRKATVLQPQGLPSSRMTGEQRRLLHAIIHEYALRARAEFAQADLREIEAAPTDSLFFAWAGPMELGKGHYYRIQGPTFLIEYDNTQNNANHVHAVWRDLANDFGEDLLKRHYDEHHTK